MVSISDIVFAVFLSVILTGTAVTANSCVFVVFCRNRHIRTKFTNSLFVTLSTSCMIVCLFYPLQCLVNIGILAEKSVCFPMTCVLLVNGLIITWTIVALTIERCVSIVYPLRVQEIITKARVTGIIGVVVAYATVCGAVVPIALDVYSPNISLPSAVDIHTECRFHTMIPSRAYIMFYLVNRVLPIPIFIGIYLRIFLVARKHLRAIAAQIAETTSTGPGRGSCDYSVARQNSPLWKREVKLSLVVFTIAIYQSICWIPQTLVLFNGRDTPALYFTLTHFFSYSNTAVYPVMYGLGNRDIRMACLKLFKCRIQRPGRR